MRRRGYPAEAIRDFCDRIGVSKANSVVDYGLLESCVRDCLNESAPRAMAVIDPLKVVIDNMPDDFSDELYTDIHPDHPKPVLHQVPALQNQPLLPYCPHLAHLKESH